ncbi:hypothetical protein EV126DRAFT_90075 [Verticillium dahliae]|nr:hypothetical protein EV126DRAFT_90075 [Verticillium dahliae]
MPGNCRVQLAKRQLPRCFASGLRISRKGAISSSLKRQRCLVSKLIAPCLHGRRLYNNHLVLWKETLLSMSELQSRYFRSKLPAELSLQAHIQQNTFLVMMPSNSYPHRANSTNPRPQPRRGPQPARTASPSSSANGQGKKPSDGAGAQMNQTLSITMMTTPVNPVPFPLPIPLGIAMLLTPSGKKQPPKRSPSQAPSQRR